MTDQSRKRWAEDRELIRAAEQDMLERVRDIVRNLLAKEEFMLGKHALRSVLAEFDRVFGKG